MSAHESNDTALPAMTAALPMSLAARMLSGHGDMMLVDYHANPQKRIAVTSHGINERGKLMVTCRHSDAGINPDALPRCRSYRVEITLGAPDFELIATIASTHALGDIQWLSSEDEWLMGVLSIDKVSVHHLAGISTFAAAEVFAAAVSLPECSTDRLSTYNTVVCSASEHLIDLADAACLGIVPADLTPPVAVPSCSHLANRVFVLDVCEVGVTLMRTTAYSRWAMFIPFESVANSHEDLSNQWEKLVAQTSARRG